MSALRILMISAEYGAIAKTGGLADMVAGLAGWLAGRGHQVDVVIPDYGGTGLPASEFVETPRGMPDYALNCRSDASLRLWQVTCPALFGADQLYYGDVHDAKRFLLLCHAARQHGIRGDLRPQILHAHDWHAAPAAAMPLATSPGAPAASSLLTIHNIGYQGVFDRAALDPGLGSLPEAGALSPHPDRPEAVNFLASGIEHATALSTVSPTHAREITTPENGMGLHELLTRRADSLHGILNGVDYGQWDPVHDPLIPFHFDARSLEGKRRNRRVLDEALSLGLANDEPLVCVISRLAEHKGMSLLAEVLPTLLGNRRFRCIILGQGESQYARAFAALSADHPQRVQLQLGHDEAFAHRLLAGADMLLMPSRYEPCGLTQLYAMRYGTIPVVRMTGGLADTVSHFDPDRGSGTGVVFRDYDAGGLAWGMGQALDWYAQPGLWRTLMSNAMASDFSWDRQGPQFEALYRSLVVS